MKAELINPFFLSLEQTIKNFSGVNIQKKKVEILTSTLHRANIHVFLGVTGDLYGNVLLSADHQSGLQLASMMIGESMEDFNDFSISALQELLNITSGNAVTQLAGMGVKTDISPPAFFAGLQLNVHVLFPLISVLLSAGGPEFYLNIALRAK